MRAVLLLAGLVSLGACNREPEVSLSNASVAEVANAVAEVDASSAMSFRPGRWETQVKLVSVEAPGLPPQAKEAMQAAFAQAQVNASCLTPEQAKKPAGDFLTGGQAQNCTYEKFQLGGGKIDSIMSCQVQGGVASRLEMNGTYDAERFDMTMKTQASAPAAAAQAAGNMTMTMQVNARRTGDCTGKERA